MSVASKNPFAILNDDDSSPPSTPAPSAQVVKEQEKVKADAPATRGAQKGKTGPASRGGRYYQRGGAANKGAPQEGDNQESTTREPRRNGGEENSRGRGRGRGRGGDRGYGGDRGGDRGSGGARGRTYDRHSQTGKTDSDKKVHQGWGGDEGISELKAEEAGNNDAVAEVVTPSNDWANDGAAPAADAGWGAPAVDAGWGTPAADAAPEGDTPAKEASAPAADDRDNRRFNRDEEDDNTLTLDEYLAQKEKDMAAIPKLEGVRKANEGSDDAIWKDAIQLSREDRKEEEDAYYVGKTKSAPKPRAEKKEKVFLEIEPRFERPSRGGRGGGRGGDRGGDRGTRGAPRGSAGRGRGGARGRGANGSTAQVDVDDQSAFPSLS